MPRSIPASAGPPAYLVAPPAWRRARTWGKGLWTPSADHRTFRPSQPYATASIRGRSGGRLRAFERPASLPKPMDVVSPELRDRGRPDLGSVPPELRI
eukprot:8807834-Alexandrium_andersonii.AAC.1